MNFTAFQHSAFLQSLGWAIANSVWQAGVCWVLYQIVVSSYATASSRLKNNISTVFLFSTLLWFATTFITKFIYLQNKANPLANQLSFSPGFSFVSGGDGLQNFIHLVGITLPYLSAAYLLLLLILTTKLIKSYHTTVFLRYNGLQKPGVELRLFVEKVAAHMNISKKIKLWFSKSVDVPATIGFLKPVILIPLASINQLTVDQLEAVILHELSHIKRNDYLINLFVSLSETVLFFNPFVMLLTKIIKKERENCCDDFVLQYQYDRHSYASALLSLEKYRNQILHLALNATSGKKQLLFRIKRIMGTKNNSNSLNYGQKLIALLLTTAIISSIAWLSPVKKLHRSDNYQQPSNKNLHLQRGIYKEKNIDLKSKEGLPIPFVAPPNKAIRKNNRAFVDIPKENHLTKKNEEFIWGINTDKIETPQLMDYNSNAIPSTPATTGDVSAENLFSFPGLSTAELGPFYKLFFEFDINKLKTDIENTRKSFSLIDWDNIKQEIVENVEKIKIATPKFEIEKEQIASDIDNLEQQKEKNLRKKFQFSFSSDDGFPLDIRANSGDSLSIKDNPFLNKPEKTLYRQINRNNPPNRSPRSTQRNNPAKVSAVVSYPEAYLYHNKIPGHLHVKGDIKPPLKQSLRIAFEDGLIFINGKKMLSSEIKKYQTQTIVKLLEDCNLRTVELEFKD